MTDITEDSDRISWCASGVALQDLVDTLASPGALSIMQALEGGPARRSDLLAGDGYGFAYGTALCDTALCDTAVTRLEALGLVHLDRSGDAASAPCSLTASGRRLLAPLAGLARWYRENRDQLSRG